MGGLNITLRFDLGNQVSDAAGLDEQCQQRCARSLLALCRVSSDGDLPHMCFHEAPDMPIMGIHLISCRFMQVTESKDLWVCFCLSVILVLFSSLLD